MQYTGILCKSQSQSQSQLQLQLQLQLQFQNSKFNHSTRKPPIRPPLKAHQANQEKKIEIKHPSAGSGPSFRKSEGSSENQFQNQLQLQLQLQIQLQNSKFNHSTRKPPIRPPLKAHQANQEKKERNQTPKRGREFLL